FCYLPARPIPAKVSFRREFRRLLARWAVSELRVLITRPRLERLGILHGPCTALLGLMLRRRCRPIRGKECGGKLGGRQFNIAVHRTCCVLATVNEIAEPEHHHICEKLFRDRRNIDCGIRPKTWRPPSE